MAATVQWVYQQRDPVSWSFAALMGLSILWGASQWPAPMLPTEQTEMLAYLETPEIPSTPIPQPKPLASPPTVASKAVTPEVPVVPVVPKSVATNTQTSEILAPAAESRATHVPTAAAPVVAVPASLPSKPLVAEPAQTMNSTYEGKLLAYLERIKRYPTSREARLTQPQGTVRLWLEISHQGELLGSGVVNSSGSNLLDSEALRTVRAGQYPSFGEAFSGQDRHRFVVALKYQIENS